ncbi:Auxin response factor 7 [Glycine soja]|nr:Auxin response factor 7 [Glycine soja]
MEHVAAYTQHQQDGHMEIPVYDLPSKILCKILHIELKAEAFSDEVYAQVTLVPALKQDNLRLEVEENDQIPSITTTYTFSKILTPSDTSTHGGFSVPKKHADECFPPLDMTQQTPAQEIVAKDLNGFEWHFRHIYRGKPKRHLLTSGWSTFVNAKKLVAGDSCIFVRAESGEIRVGIRRATEHLSNVSQSSSLISGHSMQLGILASASHAVSSGTMFIVYYHPWTNPFEFIVPLRTYLKSTVPDYPIGMRVQMQHEVEESLRRHAGTIIGHEDIDKIRWPGSEWRCLKVQWDAVLDDKMNPERVCPWWIEPLESAKEKKQVPALPTTKKALALNQRSLPGINGQNSAGPSSQTRREDRDLQGQDYSGIHSAQPLQRAPPTDVIHPSKVPIRGSRFGKENPNQLPFPMQGPLHKSLSRSMSLTHEDLSITSSNLSSIGSESLGWPSTESRNENDVPFGQPGSCSTFKLFGVSLIDRSSELPSLQSAAFNKTSSLLSNPPMRVAPGKTCKKCHRVNNRSCTKVLKLGTALGRAVDLARFHGYTELIAELDSMFEFRGSLINESSGWHVTCMDDDGDMMQLGDYPWQDFQGVVQKMIICPKEAGIFRISGLVAIVTKEFVSGAGSYSHNSILQATVTPALMAAPEKERRRQYPMNMMTTLKLNLGQHMIVSPRATRTVAFAPPSSVTVSLTHQHASAPSSSSSLILRHNGTRVRSHSQPFPESDDQVEDLRVPDNWLDPTIAFQESEWLRVTLHKWLDDEYCPEETNVEISRVAANSFYNSLLQKQTDLGEILLKMARELESINYKESFHGAFSSANAAIDLIAQRIEQLCQSI